MLIDNLNKMVKGWFVGNFSPTVIPSSEVEVAIKHYKSGETEKKHYHKVATELTAIISGSVKMNGQIYKSNDIIVMEPGEATDFIALEDSVSVVVKLPCVANDKYIVEETND